MVVTDHGDAFVEPLVLGEQVCSSASMGSQFVEVLLREAAHLAKEGCGNLNLADVMKFGSVAQGEEVRFDHAHSGTDRNGIDSDTLGVDALPRSVQVELSEQTPNNAISFEPIGNVQLSPRNIRTIPRLKSYSCNPQHIPISMETLRSYAGCYSTPYIAHNKAVNVPPSYNVPPPYTAPKKSNTSKLILLAVLLVCVPCVVLIGGGLFAFRKGVTMLNEQVIPMASCVENHTLLRDAAKEWAKNHGGKLPAGENWQATIIEDYKKLYMKEFSGSNKEVFGLKFDIKEGTADKPFECANPNNVITGIAYNKAIAGMKLDDIKDQDKTMMFFEIEKPELNAVKDYVELPKSTSPTIMGEHRDWMRMPIVGDIVFDQKFRRQTERSTGQLRDSMRQIDDAEKAEKKADAKSSGN